MAVGEGRAVLVGSGMTVGGRYATVGTVVAVDTAATAPWPQLLRSALDTSSVHPSSAIRYERKRVDWVTCT